MSTADKVDDVREGVLTVANELDELGVTTGRVRSTLWLHDLSRADFDVLAGALGCRPETRSALPSGPQWHTSGSVDGVEVSIFTTQPPAGVTA